MGDVSERTAPVLIIGGGPVGMILAMNLARLHVRSIVVNIETDSRWRPKGSTHNARTMEHLRRLGLTPTIRNVGLPHEHSTDVGYFTTLNGWELARLPMLSEAQKREKVAEASAELLTPEPLFRCNQMYVEREIHAHLKTVSEVSMHYGWRCLGFVDNGDHVTAEIEEIESGRRETLLGDYIVGCDGAQGVVRRALGIRYSGEVPEEQVYGSGATVSTHLRAPTLYDRIIRRRCWQYWVVNPTIRGLLTTLDGKGEFLFNTRCRSVDDPPDSIMIAQRLRALVGEDFAFEFIGHWPWTAGQALVADRFGAGRALLAGDAVHLFTPTGGFGLNTGVDDAANLAWKLAGAIQGWGGPKLIASYEIERRPIAFRNTGHAKRLSRSLADVPVAASIIDDSVAGAAARRETGAVLATFGEEFASLGVQLGARYDGSPIVVSDGSAPPADDPAIYVPSACPGGRAPHIWIQGANSLFDCFGRFFTLLRLTDHQDESVALASAAERRGLPLAVVDVRSSEARDVYGAGMALIRPDQHVAWRGNRLPEDPDALLAQVTGWI